MPETPVDDRLHNRYRDATEIITNHRARSARGMDRPDFDGAKKAVEILAFISGMETLWLLDPSIPLAEALKGYAESLGRETSDGARHGYRLDVAVLTPLDAVRAAVGGTTNGSRRDGTLRS